MVRRRWIAAPMAVLTPVLLVCMFATAGVAAPDESARKSLLEQLRLAYSNKDVCIRAATHTYYGKSETKCPQHKWNPLKGCRADGCCCNDACAKACRRAYCVLKKEWTVGPDNYCGQSFDCPKDWTCGED
jgi:hypothetical protein